ncbi:hypothetical protein [Salarchaeum japonicum]|uniref:Uncharacterized protein n=1 Tax=Salarchaeum japonicum TaxID=555573 RepID=A0AAV3SZ30_9EURY|nr:hypothetical protein [Salarchaeum japonicum]
MTTLAALAAFAGVGLLGTNSIPHFVQGVTGTRHMTPAGPDSSPVVNVLWGSANFAAAGVLCWQYRDAINATTLAIAFATGVALALALAAYWSE